jgi:undecaprenyl-diphosphatase
MKNIVRTIFYGDRKLFYMINGSIKCRLLDGLMPYITKLGGAVVTILLPITLIIIGKNKVRFIGIESLASLSTSHLIVQILKRTITRIRPYDILKHINTFNIYLKDYSFPSGHTTASFSIAVSIGLNVSYLTIPLLFIAGIVGVSRVYLGVHYPSDVVVGGLLGTITSFIIHSMFMSYFGM